MSKIRYVPRYRTRNEAIVARLRAEAGADAPIDPYMKIKRLTAEVAVAMALIHGGDWAVQIDHQRQTILVGRRL